jgi:hypothetical protein
MGAQFLRVLVQRRSSNRLGSLPGDRVSQPHVEYSGGGTTIPRVPLDGKLAPLSGRSSNLVVDTRAGPASDHSPFPVFREFAGWAGDGLVITAMGGVRLPIDGPNLP